MCQHFDLLGNVLDALIETPPIAAEVLDERGYSTSTRRAALRGRENVRQNEISNVPRGRAGKRKHEWRRGLGKAAGWPRRLAIAGWHGNRPP
jgi:hypothetical protein